jgi:hypothetical protein
VYVDVSAQAVCVVTGVSTPVCFYPLLVGRGFCQAALNKVLFLRALSILAAFFAAKPIVGAYLTPVECDMRTSATCHQSMMTSAICHQSIMTSAACHQALCLCSNFGFVC